MARSTGLGRWVQWIFGRARAGTFCREMRLKEHANFLSVDRTKEIRLARVSGGGGDLCGVKRALALTCLNTLKSASYEL